MTTTDLDPNNYIKNTLDIRQEIEAIKQAQLINKTAQRPEHELEKHHSYLQGKIDALFWVIS